MSGVMFVLQGEIDLNRAWDITPYNGLGYGAVVVILGIIVYFLYKENQQLKIQNQENINRLHTVTNEAIEQFSDLKHDRELKHQKVISVLDMAIDKLKNIDRQISYQSGNIKYKESDNQD